MSMARKKAFSRVRWSSRQRDRIILVACVVVVAIGLVGLVRATGWEEVRAQIAGLSCTQSTCPRPVASSARNNEAASGGRTIARDAALPRSVSERNPHPQATTGATSRIQ